MVYQDSLSEWQDRVVKLNAEIAERLIPPKELIERLQGLLGGAILGLRVKITQKHVSFDTGNLGDCSGRRKTLDEKLGGVPDARAIVTLYPGRGTSPVVSDLVGLFDLLTSFWQPAHRGKLGNLEFKKPEVQRLLEPTLNNLCGGASVPAPALIVYADLDDFKPINDQLGHPIGDEALGHVGTCALAAGLEHSVIFANDGGDEFVALLRDNGAEAALAFLWDLRSKIRTKDWSGKRVGFTAGVERLAAPFSANRVADAIKEAEKATKRAFRGKSAKKRGTVSMAWSDKPNEISADEKFAKLALAFCQTHRHETSPFANSALNWLSKCTHDSKDGGASIRKSIAEVCTWLNIEATEQTNADDFFGPVRWSLAIAPISAAAAIMHGILRRFRTQSTAPKIRLDVSKHLRSAAVSLGGVQVWSAGKGVGSRVTIEGRATTSARAPSCSILMCIGIQNRPALSTVLLPEDLFVDTIMVDDRAVSGGGLPDFWQAALAHLISILAGNRLDGVRCNTASQAYPLVLDILRSSKEDQYTYDDASQKLQEMIGFKIVLEKPDHDHIPAFWDDQRQSMDNYANSVLLSPQGLIGKHLHRGHQFARFIAHLTRYASPSSQASTRRAILIVPNQTLGNEPKPLGLVSVWATPRTVASSRLINFCLTWRTVEAFVGLPYSLYGSILLAQDVIERIKRELPRKDSERLRIGSLTYLAQSLHMRMDEYHRLIAKQIVDAASE